MLDVGLHRVLVDFEVDVGDVFIAMASIHAKVKIVVRVFGCVFLLRVLGAGVASIDAVRHRRSVDVAIRAMAWHRGFLAVTGRATGDVGARRLQTRCREVMATRRGVG
jgi:hypothetical protein